jgi:hypothetical protein
VAHPIPARGLLAWFYMKPNGPSASLVIDFLVPACLASRYRARLTALSPFEAELRLSFCPSIFRSGILNCCPAEISVVSRGAWVRARGSFRLDGGSSGTTARFHFEPPITPRDLKILQQASPEDLEVSSEMRSTADPEPRPYPSEPGLGWSSAVAVH